MGERPKIISLAASTNFPPCGSCLSVTHGASKRDERRYGAEHLEVTSLGCRAHVEAIPSQPISDDFRDCSRAREPGSSLSKDRVYKQAISHVIRPRAARPIDLMAFDTEDFLKKTLDTGCSRKLPACSSLETSIPTCRCSSVSWPQASSRNARRSSGDRSSAAWKSYSARRQRSCFMASSELIVL